MPGWEQTENEIRFRVRDSTLITPGTWFTKVLQKSPEVTAVMGRTRGEDKPSVQSIRFDKKKWTLADAQKWWKDHKDDIKKSVEDQIYGWAGVYLKDAEPQSTVSVKDIEAWKKKNLKSKDIEESEDDPHITIKYGIHTMSPADIANIIRSSGHSFIACKLGKISTFENDNDVLKIDVESWDFKLLNGRLSNETETTDTFPVYESHLTLAYLKKGKGQKYIGDDSFEGRFLIFDKVCFSDANNNKTYISLKEDDMKKNELTLALSESELECYDQLQKSGFIPQSFSFSANEFTEKAIQEWLVAKNLDVAKLKKNKVAYNIDLRKEEDFEAGTLRDIVLREGLVMTAGMLKSNVEKSAIEKKVPERFAIKAEDINDLEDIDVDELTLTSSPAVGKMAEFRIVKSLAIAPHNIQKTVPFQKFNAEKQQVYAYALVPNVPDYQGDRVTPEQIEKAAHSFMRNLSCRKQKGTGSGLEHSVFEDIGFPIESHIDRVGKHGVEGGWWVGTQITNAETWSRVRKGEIIGYSIGGSGKRKKAEIGMDAPAIAKSEDVEKITDSIISKLSAKFTGLFGKKEEKTVAEPEPTPEPAQKTNMEDKKNMDYKFLETYDMRPSELEDLQKAGLSEDDAKKWVEAVGLAVKTEKAANGVAFNFKNAGIGYTSLKLLRVVRSGNYGQFPTPEVAWARGLMKSEEGAAPPAVNPAPTPPAKKDEKDKEIEALKSENEELKKTLNGVLDRIENIEKQKGIRKSTDNVGNPDQSDPEQDYEAKLIPHRGLTPGMGEEILKAEGCNIAMLRKMMNA